MFLKYRPSMAVLRWLTGSFFPRKYDVQEVYITVNRVSFFYIFNLEFSRTCKYPHTGMRAANLLEQHPMEWFLAVVRSSGLSVHTEWLRRYICHPLVIEVAE